MQGGIHVVARGEKGSGKADKKSKPTDELKLMKTQDATYLQVCAVRSLAKHTRRRR